MTLTPEAHKQDAWWIDGNKVYIRYPTYQDNGWSDFRQGFTVRLP